MPNDILRQPPCSDRGRVDAREALNVLRLMSDVLNQPPVQRMSSADMLKALSQREGHPLSGLPVNLSNKRLLATIIRGHGAGPRQLQIGKQVRRGYDAGDVHKAIRKLRNRSDDQCPDLTGPQP